MKKIGFLVIFASIFSFLSTFILFKSDFMASISLDFLILGIIILLVGFIKEKVSKITFPPVLYKILLWIRKILGFLLLIDLLWVIIKAGLLGLYLWLMFFNVAIIFCLVLLLTKRNNLFVGIILLFLGLFYSFIPLLPGPVLTMMSISALMVPSEAQILFIWIFIAKWLVLISGIFVFISGFFSPQKIFQNINKKGGESQ